MLIDNAKLVAYYNGDAQDDYEDCCCEITTIMGYTNDWWYVEVKGFGWRRGNGHKVFRASHGRELLREILPNCDNSFKVYAGSKPLEFAINNTHHDSPMWNVEWYTIRKATEDEIAECT